MLQGQVSIPLGSSQPSSPCPASSSHCTYQNFVLNSVAQENWKINAELHEVDNFPEQTCFVHVFGLQQAFTVSGLNNLWNEIYADGELSDQSTVSVSKSSEAVPVAGSSTEAGSSSPEQSVTKTKVNRLATSEESRNAMLARWTWGVEPSQSQLNDSLLALVQDQYALARWSALSCLSLARVERRLCVVQRVLVALSRHENSSVSESKTSSPVHGDHVKHASM